MSHDDFDFEPQPGLPAPLPAGETLLWQGKPQWWALAVHAYHVRKVAAYFLILIACRVGFGVSTQEALAPLLLGVGVITLLGALAAGILAALAALSARQAIYTITSRRILIRHGVAVPLTLNIPFSQIAAADVGSHGTQGDILIRISEETRIGYLINWPYLRSGHFTRPQPSLRALRNAEEAAQILGSALQGHFGAHETRPVERESATRMTANAA